MEVRWFFAVDVAKKKPAWMVMSDSEKTNIEEPFVRDETVPKTFKTFSVHDSKRLELGYQQQKLRQKLTQGEEDDTMDIDFTDIPVQEDHLFKVDLTTLELSPIYWEGPIYEVRRGTWFIKDGSDHVPCDAELAEQLEVGFLRNKPYLINKPEESVITDDADSKVEKDLPMVSIKTTGDGEKHVIYTNDGQGGWILSSTIYGTLSSKIMTSLTADIALGGKRIVRGYPRPKPSSENDNKSPKATESTSSSKASDPKKKSSTKKNTQDSTDSSLLDKLSATLVLPLETIMSASDISDSEKTGYNEDFEPDEVEGTGTEIPGSDMSRIDVRNVDHLVLCVHGIGQRLGKRVESVNFVHDINIFRQKIKDAFTTDANADIHELLFPGLTENRQRYAKELTKRNAKDSIFQDVANIFTDSTLDQNKPKTIKKEDCTVQVLPVLWRHHIDFNITSQESLNSDDVSLNDITVKAIQPIRQLTGDLILDVLLYYQPHYLDQILRASIRECNSIYRIFKQRNPEFKGKVSIMGHSLGSAICFDMLSSQQESLPLPLISQLGFDDQPSETHLEFDVDTYLAVGSPVGLFQLLKGNRIAARDRGCAIFQDINPSATKALARPKVRQFYNIYHPCDPVAYRVEPLIHHSASQLVSELVPYTKFGFGNREFNNLTEKFTEGANWANSVWKNVLEDTENPLTKNSSNSNQGISQDRLPKQPVGHKDLSAEPMLKREKERMEAIRKEVNGKLYSLNQTGRVDYALQEGALEISALAAIASHVSYFSDQDVANFLLRALYLNQKAEDGTVIQINNEEKY
ncbi:DDHD-domain-containing protein [Nadsonia fulvescens var. elongata DSM 6958]|uniref:DDHD-domain-containing protein n=1 Tax=Nadsonia fulvescens var. elongata DSM 6958 TaxID=857566 RepID=A0A1E3PEZ8_9ASCO|nr:DDHD-domain-containing protein [Nadsonia fulvescens var. elongata DSM 6958]